MFEEQDRIQAFAKSYAERMVAEAFRDVLDQPDVKQSSFFPILNTLFQLHLVTVIEKDAAWFIENGHLSRDQGEEVSFTEKEGFYCSDV